MIDITKSSLEDDVSIYMDLLGEVLKSDMLDNGNCADNIIGLISNSIKIYRNGNYASFREALEELYVTLEITDPIKLFTSPEMYSKAVNLTQYYLIKKGK